MLLIEYLTEKVCAKYIVFEYGYYGIRGSFMKDENLSTEGDREHIISFVNTNGNLRFLYACSGECNDFEVLQDGETIYLKYIDFR